MVRSFFQANTPLHSFDWYWVACTRDVTNIHTDKADALGVFKSQYIRPPKWKRCMHLHHPERLAKIIKGVKFVNDIEGKRIAD